MRRTSTRLIVCLLFAMTIACGSDDLPLGVGIDIASTPPEPSLPFAPTPPPVPPLILSTDECSEHLKALYEALLVYKATYGSLPHETGGSFLIKLALVSPALLSLDSPLYDCPLSSTPPAPGATQFRGPSSDANFFKDLDPIAADEISAHGTPETYINVLLKDGRVVRADYLSYYWIVAATMTTP